MLSCYWLAVGWKHSSTGYLSWSGLSDLGLTPTLGWSSPLAAGLFVLLGVFQPVNVCCVIAWGSSTLHTFHSVFSCDDNLFWTLQHWHYVMSLSPIWFSCIVQSQPWVGPLSPYYTATECTLWMVQWRIFFWLCLLCLYLIRHVARPVNLCLAVFSASGVDSLLYFLGNSFFISPSWHSDNWLKAVALILAHQPS